MKKKSTDQRSTTTKISLVANWNSSLRIRNRKISVNYFFSKKIKYEKKSTHRHLYLVFVFKMDTFIRFFKTQTKKKLTLFVVVVVFVWVRVSDYVDRWGLKKRLILKLSFFLFCFVAVFVLLPYMQQKRRIWNS